MLSEYNDFTKMLDDNSYNACLHAVESAQYFILLVGARVGGLYDVSKKLSITHMEYRKAYELVKQKRIKLITFVREEIWNAREDRKGLESILKGEYKERHELDDAQIERLVHHQSTLVNDGRIVFDFLKEIARNEEMKEAMAGKGSFPVGNWIHQFSAFEDVLETLRTEFNIFESLNSIALKVNLKRELLANLIRLTFKSETLTKGKVEPITFYAQLARSHFKGGLDEFSIMPGKHFSLMVFFYLMMSGRTVRLSAQFIDQALTSGAFLEYDFTFDRYRSGLINDSLIQLKENISRLKENIGTFKDSQEAYLKKYERELKSQGDVAIRNWDLIGPFARYDCHQNIIELSMALLKAIDGDATTLSTLTFRPTSPMA
jgi:hypothetical protein